MMSHSRESASIPSATPLQSSLIPAPKTFPRRASGKWRTGARCGGENQDIACANGPTLKLAQARLLLFSIKDVSERNRKTRQERVFAQNLWFPHLPHGSG